MTWAPSKGRFSDAEGSSPWVGVHRIRQGSMFHPPLEPTLWSSLLPSALSGLTVDLSFFSLLVHIFSASLLSRLGGVPLLPSG